MSANEESYREEADNLEKVLARIEEELHPFFENHRLVIPRHIHLEKGILVVEGDNLLGSHILHPPFRLEVAHNLGSVGLTDLHEVFLTDNRMQRFRRISPFIQSATCPECRHPRVLITDGGRQFIDVLVGHRVEL
jgi:hypothetical protein